MVWTDPDREVHELFHRSWSDDIRPAIICKSFSDTENVRNTIGHSVEKSTVIWTDTKQKVHDLFGQLTPNDDPPAVVYNPNVDFRNGKEYVVDLTVLDKNNLALVLIEVILMDNFDDGVFNMACHRLSIVESIYLVICQQVNAMLNNANAGLKIRKAIFLPNLAESAAFPSGISEQVTIFTQDQLSAKSFLKQYQKMVGNPPLEGSNDFITWKRLVQIGMSVPPGSDPVESFFKAFICEAEEKEIASNSFCVKDWDRIKNSRHPYLAFSDEISKSKDTQTLEKFIHDNGSLIPFNALLLAKNVASALAFMHANGFIHRDINEYSVIHCNSSFKLGGMEDLARDNKKEKTEETKEAMTEETRKIKETVDPKKMDLWSLGRTIVYAVTGEKFDQLPSREKLKELIKDEGIVDVVTCLKEKNSACDVLKNVHLLFLGADDHIKKEWLALNERTEHIEIEQNPYESLVKYLDAIRKDKFDISVDSNPTEWLTALLEIIGFPKLVTTNFVEEQSPDLIFHFNSSEWIESYLDYLLIQIDPAWLSCPHKPWFSDLNTGQWFDSPYRNPNEKRSIKFLQFADDKDLEDQIDEAWKAITDEIGRDFVQGKVRYFHGFRGTTYPTSVDKLIRISEIVRSGVMFRIEHEKTDFSDPQTGFYLHVRYRDVINQQDNNFFAEVLERENFGFAVQWALNNGIIGAVIAFSYKEDEDKAWRDGNPDGIYISDQENIPSNISECFKGNITWTNVWKAIIKIYREDHEDYDPLHLEYGFKSKDHVTEFKKILDDAPFIEGWMYRKKEHGDPKIYEREESLQNKKLKTRIIQLCIKSRSLGRKFDEHMRAIIFFVKALKSQQSKAQCKSSDPK